MIWILKLFRTDSTKSIQIGSRVRTEIGEGVVTNGAICIKYDNPLRGRMPNDKTMVHNIQKVTLL